MVEGRSDVPRDRQRGCVWYQKPREVCVRAFSNRPLIDIDAVSFRYELQMMCVLGTLLYSATYVGMGGPSRRPYRLSSNLLFEFGHLW